jgi:alpha-glucosidase
VAPRSATPTPPSGRRRLAHLGAVGNHDSPRPPDPLGQRGPRPRPPAVVLLTLRGTPFLYAGDELGLEDAEVPDDRVVDPGRPRRLPRAHAVGRVRGTAGPGAVAAVERRRSNALRDGSWALLESPQDVLAYERAAGDDVRRIAANFGAGESGVSWREPWRVVVATDVAREGAVFDGRLAGDSAVIVEPA